MAISTPDVLPPGIRSLSLKMGTIGGLDQYYTNSGEVRYRSDINSVELDAQALTAINPEVQSLVTVLNQFGLSQIGDQLNLGRLSIDADPEVHYFSPVFLYGLSKKWTIGVAVPIIDYKNDVGITQRGSNLEQLRAQFHGISPEISQAFDQLDMNIQIEFNNTLAAKGYSPLKSKNEQFIGDVQLISAYQIPQSANETHAAQTVITLPTGPQPDPDDLTDIETFGRWAIQPGWVSAKKLSGGATLLGQASYKMVLPLNMVKRAPLDRNDRLPDQMQKMTTREDIGDTWSILGGYAYRNTTNLTTTVAYVFEDKAKDHYGGLPTSRARLLEQDTDRQAHIMKIEFFYSTVQDYMRKNASIPGDIAYEISTIVAGRNIENSVQHDIWMRLFF